MAFSKHLDGADFPDAPDVPAHLEITVVDPSSPPVLLDQHESDYDRSLYAFSRIRSRMFLCPAFLPPSLYHQEGSSSKQVSQVVGPKKNMNIGRKQDDERRTTWSWAFLAKSSMQDASLNLKTFCRFQRVAGLNWPIAFGSNASSDLMSLSAPLTPSWRISDTSPVRSFSFSNSQPTARAVISNLMSRGLSTSSSIAWGALSPERLPYLCIRV